MKTNPRSWLVSSIGAVSFLAVAVIPSTVKAGQGEFGGQCAMGLSLGMSVKTNCKVTWTSEEGKTYCFSSERSKTSFLKDPKQNLAKAQEFYEAKDQP